MLNDGLNLTVFLCHNTMYKNIFSVYTDSSNAELEFLSCILYCTSWYFYHVVLFDLYSRCLTMPVYNIISFLKKKADLTIKLSMRVSAHTPCRHVAK